MKRKLLSLVCALFLLLSLGACQKEPTSSSAPPYYDQLMALEGMTWQKAIGELGIAEDSVTVTGNYVILPGTVEYLGYNFAVYLLVDYHEETKDQIYAVSYFLIYENIKDFTSESKTILGHYYDLLDRLTALHGEPAPTGNSLLGSTREETTELFAQGDRSFGEDWLPENAEDTGLGLAINTIGTSSITINLRYLLHLGMKEALGAS